jgi:bifunctional non-homologous end joining protein LigD
VYSLRAKERPTVSTPVRWEEVEQCLDGKDANLLVFDSDQALQRADKFGDLFEPVLELKQKLPPITALEKFAGGVKTFVAREGKPKRTKASKASEEAVTKKARPAAKKRSRA